MKDDYDGAEPSGNSVATDVLLRLAELTGDLEFRSRAEKALSAFAPKLRAQPTMAPQMAAALGRWLAEPEQVVLRYSEENPRVEQLLSELRHSFHPYSVVMPLTDAEANSLQTLAPFLSQLERKGAMTLYECRNFVCELPKIIM